MKYTITYFAANGYTHLKDITIKEYNSLKSAREFVLFYYNFEQLFNLFKNNTFEFWQYYFEVCEKNRFKIISLESESDSYSIYFNIKLSNILSAFRLYIDQIPIKLKGKFKYNIDIQNKFITESNNIYDLNFCYRFFYKLRNFTQHFALPISIIKYSTKSTNNYLAYSINLIAKKENLLEYNGWGKIKSEIENLSMEISLNNYIHEFFYLVSSLHSSLRTFYYSDYVIFENILNSIKIECEYHYKKKYKSTLKDFNIFINRIEDENIIEDELWLPISKLQVIYKYTTQNVFNENIIKSYSTNKLI